MSQVEQEVKKMTEEREEESTKQETNDSASTAAATTPNISTVAQETEGEEAPTTTAPNTTEDLSHLPENVRILKEAFPDIDVDVIETILQMQGNSVDSAFEVLLGMSDPSYISPPSPPPPTQQQQQRDERPSAETTPPMPPRPSGDRTNSSDNSGHAPYAYFERQTQPAPTTVEEQLRMDEEFAKKLALEDEMRNERRLMRQHQKQQQQQQQQQRRESENDDDSLFNLQEELPIIKEKMREAGNAAKKKMMDFYNQIKANTRNNNTSHTNDAGTSSSIPTTNAQYRGLPSDDGDDLLTGDISALHLSDYDVYAQTGGRQKKSNNGLGDGNDTIIVNPSINIQTSTSDAQMKADEDFAKQLEEEERREARRSRQSFNEDSLGTTQTPARKTVVIAPRSLLEFEGDSDYEYIGLNANNNTSNNNKNTTTKSAVDTTEDNSATVPYVIGDDDDSDSDDLVDIDEDELFDDEEEEEEKEKGKADKKESSSTAVRDLSKATAPATDEEKDSNAKSDGAELTSSNTSKTTTTNTTPVISNK